MEDGTNDLPVTNKRIVAYCDREHAMQRNVFPKQIDTNKLKREDARLFWRVINELKGLAADAELRGLTWQDVREIVRSYSENQQKLF